ncbi:diaminopimelate epimerase [Clostridia bacterium]|nr:diaminopimelate epimerase [Clostridia bacterium]
MEFTKMHGLGNDFVMVKENNLPSHIALDKLSIAICDRHFGVGADGLIIACPSDESDIKMRIINSDGSEAEMCGNGIRCFAKFVYEENMVRKTTMTVETLAGTMVPVLNMVDNEIDSVTVDMNEPRLAGRIIPVDSDLEQIVDHTLDVNGDEKKVTCVSMGNPHCILFVDDIKEIPLTTLGPIMEKHEFFPNKTNVEFVEVMDKNEIAMRVWERGASETLACGTGACATLVASVLNNKSKRDAVVHLAGGDLHIRWNKEDNHVYMTGPADNVFTGNYII